MNINPQVCPTCGICPTCGKKTMPYLQNPFPYYTTISYQWNGLTDPLNSLSNEQLNQYCAS